MTELKTEPGWTPPRSKRPWWLYAILSGGSAGAAIAAAMGLSSPARGQEPHVAVSGFTQQQDEEWRRHIDAKLSEVSERLARIEGRLDRK